MAKNVRFCESYLPSKYVYLSSKYAYLPSKYAYLLSKHRCLASKYPCLLSKCPCLLHRSWYPSSGHLSVQFEGQWLASYKQYLLKKYFDCGDCEQKSNHGQVHNGYLPVLHLFSCFFVLLFSFLKEMRLEQALPFFPNAYPRSQGTFPPPTKFSTPNSNQNHTCPYLSQPSLLLASCSGNSSPTTSKMCSRGFPIPTSYPTTASVTTAWRRRRRRWLSLPIWRKTAQASGGPFAPPTTKRFMGRAAWTAYQRSTGRRR